MILFFHWRGESFYFWQGSSWFLLGWGSSWLPLGWGSWVLSTRSLDPYPKESTRFSSQGIFYFGTRIFSFLTIAEKKIPLISNSSSCIYIVEVHMHAFVLQIMNFLRLEDMINWERDLMGQCSILIYLLFPFFGIDKRFR